MSDPNLDYDDDLDDDDLDEPEGETGLLKQLRTLTRNQKKQIKDLQRQVSASSEASKRLALLEADLPKTKQMDYFLSHYEGDYSAEAIRAAAAEAGFLEIDDGVADDLDGAQQISDASRGGFPSAAPGTDKALMEKIKGVTLKGPAASAEIARIMKEHGRLLEEE